MEGEPRHIHVKKERRRAVTPGEGNKARE